MFIGSIFHSIVTVNDTLIIQEHERRIRSASFDTYLQAILPHFTLVAEFSLQDTCYQSVYNATFYVDGTSVGSVTVPTDVNQPGDGLGIGNGAKDWTTGPWAGKIADFQLLNSALTADQVAAYGAPTPAVPEPTTTTLSLLALAGLAARRRASR